MEIKLVELDMEWPGDLSILDLRSWIVNQLTKHGEPLRWAITDIQAPMANAFNPQLRVEAIIIIH